jgi:hypothetical protein
MSFKLSHLETVYIAGRPSKGMALSHVETVYIAGRVSKGVAMSHMEVVYIEADPTYIPYDPNGVKQRRITSLMIN